jgi:adenosylcobyric acid synthase
MLDIDIEDEDSLETRLHRRGKDVSIDIAVVGVPHISNFTDFTALQATPGVGLRYVYGAADLGAPDLLILPGTKNTVEDLVGLRECGLEAAIKSLAARGTCVLGICGGYQMLGERITDDAGAEGKPGAATVGMGLLPVVTRFDSEKRRTRVGASALEVDGVLAPLSGARVEGYEIHMGSSAARDGRYRPLLRLSDGSLDGCQSGNVYGTYLHGFFDSAQCRDAILGALARAKGAPSPERAFDYAAYKDRQYDLLADGVRGALNMPLIYRILDRGI